MESGELSLDHFSVATSSVRQKFRKQRRDDHIQNSFKAVRQKISFQQQQQKQRKQAQNISRALRSASPMRAEPAIINGQNSGNHMQNYHQNSCFNVSIANVNFGNNNQASYNPQFGYNQNQNDQNIGNQISPIKNIQNILNCLQPLANPQYHQPPQQPALNIIPNISQNNNNINSNINKINNQATHNNNTNKPIINRSTSPNKIPVSPYKIHSKHNNYLVYDHIIGTGTYSKVYLGLDMLRNQKVAVKAITQLQENQIKVLMSVDSPYIIKLQAFWKQNYGNYTYLVLDLCQSNLRQQLKKGLNYDQIVNYLQQIVQGIDALFSKNIIHRDLKFQNILVTKNKTAKITDFGLAKDMGMMSNVASLRCGTPYTMPPQIFFHAGYTRPYYSQKCDIWSLGVILHQMLYKKHPFNYQSERMARMERTHIQRKFGYLDYIIDGALVKNPHQRICWTQLKDIVIKRGLTIDRIAGNKDQSKEKISKRKHSQSKNQKNRIAEIQNKSFDIGFNKQQKKYQQETSIQQTAEQSQININLRKDKLKLKDVSKDKIRIEQNQLNHGKSRYQQPQILNRNILEQIKSPSCNPIILKAAKSKQKTVCASPIKREDPYKIFRQPIKQSPQILVQKNIKPSAEPLVLIAPINKQMKNKEQQFIIPPNIFKWQQDKQQNKVEPIVIKQQQNNIAVNKQKHRDSALYNSLNASSHGSTLLLKLMFGVVAIMLVSVLFDLTSI